MPRKRSTPPPPDVTVSSNGIGFYTVTPLTTAAKDWVRDNADVPSWAWFGMGFHMDSAHLVESLVDGMTADGLVVIR